MAQNARFSIVAALLVVSFVLLPQIALPYRRVDWRIFVGIYPTPTPAPGTFTFVLWPGGRFALNDIAVPLDVTASGITNAESLAVHIETQGGAPFGSVQQLLKWDAPLQSFAAWSHEFGFGDNFAIALGDFILLILTPDAPTSVTFNGRVPAEGEVRFDLVRGQSSSDCALNFLSLPLDQGHITNADQLSDDIGGVIQALDWDASIQNFLAWSNEFNFGDNFATTLGYPYIVCLESSGSSHWP